jgi:predicted nucleic acid-binding protein
MSIVPVDEQHARSAGELLGRAGLSGHRCALDAMLATVALAQPRPVVLLTSDPGDLSRLTEEPGRPRREQVLIVQL